MLNFEDLLILTTPVIDIDREFLVLFIEKLTGIFYVPGSCLPPMPFFEVVEVTRPATTRRVRSITELSVEELRQLLLELGFTPEEIIIIIKKLTGEIMTLGDELADLIEMIMGLTIAMFYGMSCGFDLYTVYSLIKDYALEREAELAEVERAYLEELTDKIIELSQDDPRYKGILPDNPENPFRKKN